MNKVLMKVDSGNYDPLRQIVAVLREARRKRGITQKELAQLSGITQPDISRFENGRGNPSVKTLSCLARGMGMFLDISFSEEPPASACRGGEPGR